MAFFQAVFGDLEGAMGSLERAFDPREVFLPWIGSNVDSGDLTTDRGSSGVSRR